MHEAIRRADPSCDYELLQRVGSGSYGEVYKARDLRNGEFAAVKLVKLETGDNFVAIQQEILVLKDCIHRNIISYYGSYLKRDRLWIVMEYCSGGSLQDIYQMTGPLTELQIAFVCRETLNGLKYLHQRGKVHRDVKGANILLSHSGDVKLADFGIAAQITATLGKRMSFIGSPYWMAPEVANVGNGGGYGSECDVWAVGITSIELAELKPPYYDLHPMQVLHLLTKSNYKIPKLKDKKKWSSAFANFVKCCLTKNPKKRPSPDKLLTNDPFVSGALSSRLTRELLDRVNHPERVQLQNQPVVSGDVQPIEGVVVGLPPPPYEYNEGLNNNGFGFESEQENDFRPLQFRADISPRHQQQPPPQRIIDFAQVVASPPSSSSASSSRECLHSAGEEEEERQQSDGDVFSGDPKKPFNKQQSYHSDRTLLASQSSRCDLKSEEDTLQENAIEREQPKAEARVSDPVRSHEIRQKKKRPRDLGGLLPRPHRPISSASEQPSTPSKANRLLSRIDESFRNRWLKLRSKSTSMVNVPFHMSAPPSAGSQSPWVNRSQHNHQPFQSRPLTCCFGMVPTPQVTMGACFVTVIHQTPIRVNCCTQWFQPANRKQFMVVGAEQGIFAFDLSEMTSEEESMIQLHERRCTWLYVVNDTITALQGKTPYLYRHELLQLFKQELITQKLAKSLDKFPQKLKPKALLSTLRMPETRDCYQCTVERSINDGNLYLCCAVPNAVLLFRWYEPLSRFVWLKRVELDKLTTPCPGSLRPYKPFSLIFGSSAVNSDYPLVCIGISRALTSPVGTAQELLHVLRNKPQKDKLELQLVDFNDTGGGKNSGNLGELFGGGGLFGDQSSDDEAFASDDKSQQTITSGRTIWRWREKLENVVALRQLDRDTLFIAHDNQIVITDFNGNEKKTSLMQTSFQFDFRLEYAIPLSDSVLAFHRHGVVGKSFFNGATTQDLHDASKVYELVGRDTLIVLKTSKRLSSRYGVLSADESDGCVEPAEPPATDEQQKGCEEEICVLTGHISTMTPP